MPHFYKTPFQNHDAVQAEMFLYYKNYSLFELNFFLFNY